jgi:hypothetical protein
LQYLSLLSILQALQVCFKALILPESTVASYHVSHVNLYFSFIQSRNCRFQAALRVKT